MTQANHRATQCTKTSITSQLTANALADYDRLPDSAHVRVGVVASIRGCSVPTVWRHTSQGILPKPKKFGGITAWSVKELRQAMAG